MNLYQDMKQKTLAIHFIETSPSLLREVPGLHLQEVKEPAHEFVWAEH
jgi:hypothetical protein